MLSNLLALALGAWVGWAVGRRPRTVAQPARPFTGGHGEWWHTFPATANSPAWTYTTKHPLQ